MKVKHTFIAVSRLRTAEGQLFKNADKAIYMAEQEHPAIAGKEFCNQVELHQAIADYNSTHKEPFTGEVILLPVYQFE